MSPSRAPLCDWVNQHTLVHYKPTHYMACCSMRHIALLPLSFSLSLSLSLSPSPLPTQPTRLVAHCPIFRTSPFTQDIPQVPDCSWISLSSRHSSRSIGPLMSVLFTHKLTFIYMKVLRSCISRSLLARASRSRLRSYSSACVSPDSLLDLCYGLYLTDAIPPTGALDG